MKQSYFALEKNSSMISDDGEDLMEEESAHRMISAQDLTKAGLSELSKQLRSLQHVNHSQSAHINKLERKLQILSDLKGVSVNDMSSALKLACQAEAFNELRIEVETLRAQLDVARSNASRSSSKSHVVANLEVRVGELEEIEESLRSKLSSLYDSLREQTTKATQFEASSLNYQKQAQEYKLKFEDIEKKLQLDQDTAIGTLQQELESATSRIIEADNYLIREKERVSALLVQVAGYDQLELQVIRQKAAMQDLNDSVAQQCSDINATHKWELEAIEATLKKMKERALEAESKFHASVERIKTMEQQSAHIVSLEMIIAGQKDQLQHLTNQSGNLESERNIVMESVQNANSEIQAKLEIQMVKSAALEQRLAEREKELEDQLATHKNYKTMRDNDVSSQSIACNETAKIYESRISMLEKQLSAEKERSEFLENQGLTHQDLSNNCETLKNDITTLAKRELVLQKELEGAKKTIDRLQNQLTENDLKIKLKKEENDSLNDQLTSIEQAARLRKKQFKTRFRDQEQQIDDLEQQLSSLVTTFNLERGERNEAHRTQHVLKESLVAAGAEVAHHLHDTEGGNKQILRSPESLAASHSFSDPSSPASSAQFEPFNSHNEVGIAQGYLLKKEFAGWRRKYFYLHGNLTTGFFTLSFGDGPGKATKGGVNGISTGVSLVQRTYEFPKKRFCFVLKLNPNDLRSPIIYLSASCQEDLDSWIAALTLATQGFPSTPAAAPGRQRHFAVGSKVIITGLVNHPEYNGLSGVVTGPLKDFRQCVSIDALQRKVKLSPANLELLELPDSDVRHRVSDFL